MSEQPTADSPPSARSWDPGITHQFGTLLGATVDLYAHPYENHMGHAAQGAEATCTGCGDSHGRDQIGRVRDWAQEHAAMCRGLPRPEVRP